MKRRGPLVTLLVFVGLIGAWFTTDLVQSREPLLGLDLQGGLSAIYSPVEPASQDDLVVIRDLMRDQLTSFGIAEPDVRVEGSNIVVDLPGVTDQEQAFSALQVSGIVTLRPVLQCGPAPVESTTTADTSGSSTSTPEQVSNVDGSDTGTITGTNPGTTSDSGTVTGTDSETVDSGVDPVPTINLGGGSDDSSGSADETSLGFAPSTSSLRPATAGVSAGAGRPMVRPATAPPDGSEDSGSDDTGTDDSGTDDTGTDGTGTDGTGTDNTGTGEPVTPDSTLPNVLTPPTAPPATTPSATGEPSDQTVMPYPAAREICLVGPSGGTGEVFERGSAQAGIDQQNGQWVVNVSLKPEGNTIWNTLATACFNGDSTCPSRQLAIALDNQIQSAPIVNEPTFSGGVQISGQFQQEDARALAMTLNRGAFPVPIEQQRLETVSPTAGGNSLNAAIIAGLIGIALMLLFMVAYYRRLSVVIIPGLLVWGMTVYTLATFVSRSSNYALTLAGATGIIVAVGVTVDTYVVYFERLREEVRHGRTYRNAAERSFRVTWRTILSADLVSLIASFVLFLLSVGSVKGFALYLGLTTVCDLTVFYFFTRPLVALLARSGWLDKGRQQTAGAPVGATS